MSTAAASELHVDIPAEGSDRRQRVEFLVTLMRSYPGIPLDRIREVLGWTYDELLQVANDYTAIASDATR